MTDRPTFGKICDPVVFGNSRSQWKILILGAPHVGKSCLVYRFVTGNLPSFEDEQLLSEISEKRVELPNMDPVHVSLWSLPAGVSKPSELTSNFYRGAHGCVFVFSTTDQQSFTDLADWYTTLSDFCVDIPVVFAENKIDLIENTVLDQRNVESMAKNYKLRLYRTSAKANHNVEEMFDYIIGKAVAQFPQGDLANRPGGALSEASTKCHSAHSSREELDMDHHCEAFSEAEKGRIRGVNKYGLKSSKCLLM